MPYQPDRAISGVCQRQCFYCFLPSTYRHNTWPLFGQYNAAEGLGVLHIKDNLPSDSRVGRLFTDGREDPLCQRTLQLIKKRYIKQTSRTLRISDWKVLQQQIYLSAPQFYWKHSFLPPFVLTLMGIVRLITIRNSTNSEHNENGLFYSRFY